MDTPISRFCQEKSTCEEILNLPIAISTDIMRAGVILNRKMFKMAPSAPIEEQARLGDILELLGSQLYIYRLTNGIHAQKKELWAAAFGITEGDRSKGEKAHRPGKPSGLLQIDLDHYSNDIALLQQIQNKLMQLPYIIATFLSPSQDGVKAIAVLKKPSDFQQARALGIACTKEVCDYLDIVGYREDSKENKAVFDDKKTSRFDLLPKEIQEKFGHAHIDFSVANDPKKACFIPPRRSNLLIKQGDIYRFGMEDDSEIGSGWYYQGCYHPFYSKECQKPFINTEIVIKRPAYRPTAYEDRWQQYVKSAIEHEFNAFANAGAGCHHQAAINLGRTIKKYAAYLSNINDLFIRADTIIDGWNPSASNPMTEKKTVRDMQAYAETVSREQWIAQQKAEAPVEKKEIPTLDISEVDLRKAHVELTKDWREKTASKLIWQVFRKYYRLTTPSEESSSWQVIDLRNKEVLNTKVSEQLLSKKWSFTKSISDHKTEYGKFSINKLIEENDITGMFVKVINSYKYEPQSLCKAFNEETQKEELYYNKCLPIVLKKDLKPDMCSKEYKLAQRTYDFIKSRFSADEDIQACVDYYIAWILDIVNNPAHRCQTNILFANFEGGTGKSTLAFDIPRILLGKSHAIATTLSKDGFSDGSETKLLVHFNEVTEALSESLDRIKVLVDSDSVPVNQKNVAKTEIETCVRVTAGTNYPYNFKLRDQNDRRWTVFSFSKKIDPDSDLQKEVVDPLKYASSGHSVFKEKCPQYNIDMFRACLYDVFTKSIEGKNINIRKPLPTRAKEELISANWTSKSVVKWAMQYFINGSTDVILYRNQRLEAPCVFLRSHLYSLLSKRKSEDSKATYSKEQIKEQLKNCGLFEEYVDRNGQYYIFFSKLGLKMLDSEDREGYTEVLEKFKNMASKIFKERIAEVVSIKSIEEQTSEEQSQEYYADDLWLKESVFDSEPHPLSIDFDNKTDTDIELVKEIDRLRICSGKEQRSVLRKLIANRSITIQNIPKTNTLNIKLNNSQCIIKDFILKAENV